MNEKNFMENAMVKYASLLFYCICFSIGVVTLVQKLEIQEQLGKVHEKVIDEEEHGKKDEEEEPISGEVILEGHYPIMGTTDVTLEQMVAYFKQSGKDYPAEILGEGGAPDIETFCQIYQEEAKKEGVRTEVAFAQTMKETGWLQYGGDAEITQFNFAGLGTTGEGVKGNSFADVREGVRAQIQHLKAYATEEILVSACVDSRYGYVSKGCAPYVEWLGKQENPEGYGWATGENYGYDIVKMIKDMKNM